MMYSQTDEYQYVLQVSMSYQYVDKSTKYFVSKYVFD